MVYFLIAGERSGDEFAAGLVSAIKCHDSSASFFGYGGDEMKSAGVQLLRHYATFSSFGIFDVLVKIRFYNRLIYECLAYIEQVGPQYLILVDFPGFNLQISRRVKKVKVIYCIPPKLWAWGAGRAETLRKHVDQIHLIFPFEADFYKARGIDSATYIGNPSNWKISRLSKSTFKKDFQNSKKNIAFLPGSRPGEVQKHIKLVSQLATTHADRFFLVSMVDTVSPKLYAPLKGIKNIRLIPGNTYELLCISSLAIVASGTATLETALLRIPQIVIYRTNLLTYLVARLLLKIRYISLVNILLNRELIPECIQFQCTPKAISKKVLMISGNSEMQKKISEGYSEISVLLGEADPFDRSARLILAKDLSSP